MVILNILSNKSKHQQICNLIYVYLPRLKLQYNKKRIKNHNSFSDLIFFIFDIFTIVIQIILSIKISFYIDHIHFSVKQTILLVLRFMKIINVKLNT